MNGAAVSLHIGKNKSRTIRLKVSKRETVRLTVSGLPVTIRVTNEKNKNVGNFQSEKEDGEWTAKLDNTWALLNLIAAIVTVVISGIKLFGVFGKNRKDSDNEDKNNDQTRAPESAEADAKAEEEEPEQTEIKRRRTLKILSLLPAIASVVTFILTEDLAGKMVWTDRWTLLMLVYLGVQVVLAFLSRNKEVEPEDKDDQNQNPEQEATA